MVSVGPEVGDRMSITGGTKEVAFQRLRWGGQIVMEAAGVEIQRVNMTDPSASIVLRHVNIGINEYIRIRGGSIQGIIGTASDGLYGGPGQIQDITGTVPYGATLNITGDSFVSDGRITLDPFTTLFIEWDAHLVTDLNAPNPSSTIIVDGTIELDTVVIPTAAFGMFLPHSTIPHSTLHTPRLV